METDADDFLILKKAYQSLKPGGKLILTTLNAMYLLSHSEEKGHHFDLLTFRDQFTYEGVDDAGKLYRITGNERYYVPSEITWRLKSLGFKSVQIAGCRLGQFSLAHPLTPNDLEMLVVAAK